MAGSSASKKVARAARTGGGRRRNLDADLGFYAVLAALVLIGTSLVIFSRNERLSASDPGSIPPLATTETRPGDRWFAAYGIYVCDKFVPPINNPKDPYGVATDNDGVVHIHPFQKKYAGHNTNLGLFTKAVDLKLSRDSLQVPGDQKQYKNDTAKCGDKPGELVVKSWSNAKDEKSGEVVKGDPNRLLLKDNQAITIAFVPKGDRNIPLPESAKAIEAVRAKDIETQNAAAAQTTPGGPGIPSPGGPGIPSPLPGQPGQGEPGQVPPPQPGPAAPAPGPAAPTPGPQ